MELINSDETLSKIIVLGILQLLKQFFVILLAAIFLVTSPFLIALLLPLYLYRYVLGHSLQFFNSKFGKLLSARAAIFAHDDLYKHPKFTILTGSTLEGNVDFELLKTGIRSNLIEKKLPNGSLRFPELQQYIIPWGGFMFWKTDTDFNIDNHVKVFSPEDKIFPEWSKTHRYDDTDLKKIHQILIEQPWVKGQPLWNILVINDYFPQNSEDSLPKSVLYLRCHHSLADGFSSRFLLSEGVFGMKSEDVEHQLKTIMERVNIPKVPIWYYFVLPFLCAYEAASVVLKFYQRTPWRPSEKEQTGKFHLKVGEVIPISVLKRIKSHFEVSFSSVTTSVVCGAIRELMIKKGVRVPKDMLCAMALPLPRSQVNLRNIMTGSFATMPLMESDPIKRLQFCNEDNKRLKRSTLPLQTHWAFSFMGSLFNPWCKAVSRNRFVPLVMSSMVAGTEYYNVNGHKMIDGFFAVGPQIGSAGLSFWMGSYVDIFRISVVAEASVLSGDETLELTREIVKQVDILLQLANV